MKLKSLLLVGGALLTGTAASAGGFQVNLGGQKNIGMGGVGVGLSLDQAAMFYNPGALAMVRSNGVQLGVNGAMARVSFRPEVGTQQRDLQHDIVTPFNFYAAFGPKEGKWKAGVAVYTPFGSKLRYADGWEGRYSLTEINLQSVFVQPTVSYAITENLSIGAGLVILAYGAVNLQKDAPIQDQNGNTSHVTLDGHAKNKIGYNAGIYYKPSEKLGIGISYRSKVDATVEGGDVTYSNLPQAVGSNFTANKFDVTLPLPSTVSVGVGVMPNEKLTLGFDVNFVQWSQYKTLNFAFSGNNGNGATAGLVGGSATSTSIRDYQDALTFRLGGQYQVTSGLTVRAGTAYDFTPVRDGFISPETPDANRLSLSAGASYAFGEKFGVDLSFLYENLEKRSQSQGDLINNKTNIDRVAGTYKTVAYVPGVGLHYKF